ncbi:hypothetical protein AJ87_35370 [Rhizobium yanglingense]|nr:hypothetical protein AJ87_35370 [Rhizobium yanglingense]
MGRSHHSPKMRSGPSARFTRRRLPRQVKTAGGWSGSKAITSIRSGESRRDGLGHFAAQFSPVSSAVGLIFLTDLSGTSEATGATR